MSKIKFRIGGSPGVVFNLPSRKTGDSSTCVGKVVVDIYGLQCSESLSFSRESLLQLCNGAKKLFSSLKGKISISSTCESFTLIALAGSTGNIKIEVSMKKYQFSKLYNAEWQAQGCFHDNPECLLQLIKVKDEITS